MAAESIPHLTKTACHICQKVEPDSLSFRILLQAWLIYYQWLHGPFPTNPLWKGLITIVVHVWTLRINITTLIFSDLNSPKLSVNIAIINPNTLIQFVIKAFITSFSFFSIDKHKYGVSRPHFSDVPNSFVILHFQVHCNYFYWTITLRAELPVVLEGFLRTFFKFYTYDKCLVMFHGILPSSFGDFLRIYTLLVQWMSKLFL